MSDLPSIGKNANLESTTGAGGTSSSSSPSSNAAKPPVSSGGSTGAASNAQNTVNKTASQAAKAISLGNKTGPQKAEMPEPIEMNPKNSYVGDLCDHALKIHAEGSRLDQFIRNIAENKKTFGDFEQRVYNEYNDAGDDDKTKTMFTNVLNAITRVQEELNEKDRGDD